MFLLLPSFNAINLDMSKFIKEFKEFAVMKNLPTQTKKRKLKIQMNLIFQSVKKQLKKTRRTKVPYFHPAAVFPVRLALSATA